MDNEYPNIIVIREFSVGYWTLFQAATDYCIQHRAISVLHFHTNAAVFVCCCRRIQSLPYRHVPHSMSLLRWLNILN